MLVLSQARILLLLFLTATMPLSGVKATSFKMDFLSAGTVRTDPLMFTQVVTQINHKHDIFNKREMKDYNHIT